MAAPSLISVTATAVNNGTTPKTTASISVQAGDILVAFTGGETSVSPGNYTVSDSGGNSWTRQQAVVPSPAGSTSQSEIFTAVAAATTSITVSSAIPSAIGGTWFGLEVHVWRGSSGVGNTAKSDNGSGSGAPSVSITTTQANSG